jgi:hypothetical protein
VPQLYNARTLLVVSADAAPDALFGGAASGEEPIIDFEGLQFETAVEGEGLLGPGLGRKGVGARWLGRGRCPQSAPEVMQFKLCYLYKAKPTVSLLPGTCLPSIPPECTTIPHPK